MRILLVSHPPLSTESGAAQIALHLGAALRELGHDAVAWSPEPLPAGVRWWELWLRRRQAIERFVAAAGPFDVFDAPAISASPELARRGFLVVRSIQPELRYLTADLADQLLGPHFSLRAPLHALHDLPVAASILAGWRRARAILCMGRLEHDRMRRRFPRWAGKLGCYLCAPSDADRDALLAVRRARGAGAPPEGGTRWLWIGRWAAHKGTARLLAWFTERAAAHSNDTLTVAGGGAAAARDWSQGARRELLAAGRVRLVPQFSRAELSGLLAGCDAGLFTSHVEGWGLSLNEMLEAGLPVYATAAGGVPDLSPCFPRDLRDFPPPPGPPPSAGDDLAASGYLARFNWAEIARSYERQVLDFREARAAPAGSLREGETRPGIERSEGMDLAASCSPSEDGR